MSFEYYYDSMITSPDLTYRILGVRSTSGSNSVRSSDTEVILKDFIREPLSFSVAHAYANTGGGVSSILTNLKTTLGSAGIKWEQFKGKWEEFLQQIGIRETTPLTADKYAVQVPWIDYYKTFQNTQVSFPMAFNARLYPKVESRGQGKGLIDVKTQVHRINEFFVGTGKIDSSSESFIYYPPHGYSPSTAEVGGKISGTLTLLYGRFAVIENLILSSYSVTFSRELIRTNPGGVDSSDSNASYYTPAYADVSVILEPSTVLTQSDLNTLLASDFYAKETDSASWMVNGKTSEYYSDSYSRVTYSGLGV